jgi:hypothetical protein
MNLSIVPLKYNCYYYQFLVTIKDLIEFPQTSLNQEYNELSINLIKGIIVKIIMLKSNFIFVDI